MNPVIPYGRQSINEKDIQAVVDVLRSDYLTQGPAIPAFEEQVGRYCQAKHVLAVNSATSGLHIACLALGVGEGDIVWTNAITFAASSNCALYCGAEVDFVDVDPRTFNLDLKALESKLTQAKSGNKLPKVLVAVHMCGQPNRMQELRQITDQFGVKIIEDASHAIGSRYKDIPTGSCQFSDVVIFSFHPVKIITTGEGGMVLTNNDKWAEKMRLLRTHGITRDLALMESPNKAGWYYEQVDLGFNYRMTDIQAALGISQFGRIDEFLQARHRIADRYDELLKSLPLTTPKRDPESYSAFHLYVIRVKLKEIQSSRDEVFAGLRERGIGVNMHYIPVYLHPYYKKLGFKPGHCPEAEAYYSDAISIPMYASLKEEEQDRVVQALREVLSR